VLHGLVLAIALGANIDLARALYVALGLLFLLLGNVMAKLRPNYFAGIRTPWTLASARSWTATHRVGGRAFVGFGLGFLLMALVYQAWFLILVMVGFGLSLVWLFYYSYRVWRDDPERVPVGQTTPAELADHR